MTGVRNRCALAGAALLVSVPALLPHHAEPLLAFYQDWLAFMVGFLAALPILWPRKNERLPLPPMAIGLFALAIVIALQATLGRVTFVEVSATGVLYTAWAALMVMTGARLGEIFGLERVAHTLQCAFALSGFALAVTGFAQFYHLDVAGMRIITAQLGQGMAGLVGQPNYLANILACALASLLVLVANRRAHVAIALLAGAPIVAALALSGSRSAWLFMAAMMLCAIFTRQTRLAAAAAIACAAFVAVNIAIGAGGVVLPAADTTTGVAKFAEALTAPAAGSPRKALALYGWHMFAAHPLLGVGWGEFTWNSFLIAPEIGSNANLILDRHAHNLLLQMLAETGIVGALCVFLPLAAWLWWIARLGAWFWRHPGSGHINLATTWVVTIVGIHLTQAMLELPHWYAYLLGPFALVLGMAGPLALQISFESWDRFLPRAVLAAALIVACVRIADYTQLESWSRQAVALDRAGRPLTRELMVKLEQLHSTVFAPEVEFIMAQLVRGGDSATRLELNTRAVHVFPFPPLLADRIVLLRDAGKNAEADAVERSRNAVWPPS